MGFQGSNYDPGSKVVPLFILGYPTINEKPCASSRRSGGDLGTIIIIVIVIIINTRNERNRRTSWMKVHNEKRNERPHEEHFAWPFSLGIRPELSKLLKLLQPHDIWQVPEREISAAKIRTERVKRNGARKRCNLHILRRVLINNAHGCPIVGELIRNVCYFNTMVGDRTTTTHKDHL